MRGAACSLKSSAARSGRSCEPPPNTTITSAFTGPLSTHKNGCGKTIAATISNSSKMKKPGAVRLISFLTRRKNYTKRPASASAGFQRQRLNNKVTKTRRGLTRPEQGAVATPRSPRPEIQDPRPETLTRTAARNSGRPDNPPPATPARRTGSTNLDGRFFPRTRCASPPGCAASRRAKSNPRRCGRS